ncbi:MAG: tetratricopeptide repeat protein [Candidatus Obscuribacterales bacterium]|nr:tetratricopeptide repeat protein [Candidatus Obscuribacterales bacterium]
MTSKPALLLLFGSVLWLTFFVVQPGACEDAAKAGAEKKGEATSAKSGGHHVHPPLAREHYNRGVELHRGGFLNKAIIEYKEAIVQDEHMEPAYSNLGLVYTAQKSWNKALEAFDKALSMKPDRTTSLNGLGTVLYAMKRNDEAMEKWKKAIEIDPTFASAYYNMGNAYETQEKHREAMKSYVKAADVNPKMADAYYRLGSLMNKTKHTPQAQVLLTKAIKLAPDAEFARDARRQLDTIEKAFEKYGSVSSDATISGDSDSKPKVATGNSPQVKQSKPKVDDKKPGQMLKSIFKKSANSQKEKGTTNMFVQPPSQDSDLKAKPAGG